MAAGSAVGGVTVRHVDARARVCTTDPRAGRTGTSPTRATCASRTLMVARAAVVRVRGRIDANSAVTLPVGQRGPTDGARADVASGRRGARIVAHAAVAMITQYVDALGARVAGRFRACVGLCR